MRDSTGDEEDQKDETMVPADYATSGQIKDDEILSTVRYPRPLAMLAASCILGLCLVFLATCVAGCIAHLGFLSRVSVARMKDI